MKRLSRLLAVLLVVCGFMFAPAAPSVYAKTKTYEHFELPVNGATGFAVVDMELWQQTKEDEFEVVQYVSAGEAFTILEDNGTQYLKIKTQEGVVGYAYTEYVMINLPDVIPSIVYECTNSEESIFRSAGKALPDITGKQLYNVKAKNPRFKGETQYVMPILYTTALKVQKAQRAALHYGDSLKIYETYRPKVTQNNVAVSLETLMNSDADVYKAINKSPWHKGWFIAQGTSTHQWGIAMDCTLVHVDELVTKYCGIFPYDCVASYTEYEMPTEMHELSAAAVTFTTPVSAKTITGWKECSLAPSMTEGAKKLQTYCTYAGFTPLASEWWHFEDRYGYMGGTGNFYLLDGNRIYVKSGKFVKVYNETSKIPE